MDHVYSTTYFSQSVIVFRTGAETGHHDKRLYRRKQLAVQLSGKV